MASVTTTLVMTDCIGEMTARKCGKYRLFGNLLSLCYFKRLPTIFTQMWQPADLKLCTWATEAWTRSHRGFVLSLYLMCFVFVVCNFLSEIKFEIWSECLHEKVVKQLLGAEMKHLKKC